MFKKFLSSLLVVAMVAITSGSAGLLSPKVAYAASLTAISDTVSNLTASADANHIIKFTTPTGMVAGSTVILTFNNGTSTTGVTAADISVTAPSGVTLVAGAPGATSNWGFVNTSSTVLTFTLGSTATVAASSVVTITIDGTNKINNGSAGTTSLVISGTFGDTGTLSMAIVTNGVIAVSAQVLGSISFTLSGNSIGFGDLSTTVVRYANPGGTGSGSVVEAFNLVAGTNAPTGYSITVQGDTLKSGINSITALAANTASVPTTEQFGIRFDATGGSGVVTAPYAASGYAFTATPTVPAQIASWTGPSSNTTYSATYLANIAALTEAGSYTTAHTYVATGNF